MKSLLLRIALVAVFTPSPLAFAGAGSPPFSSGAWYPGFLNGKYFGVVSGNNISGALGFAIADGAPPFRSDTVQQAQIDPLSGGLVEIQNTLIIEDVTQNYFAIFVEGRTYTGRTSAGIDISAKKVSGALIGTDPARNIPFVVNTTLAGAVNSALPIVNRGLSGGFEGKIKSDKDPVTFKADGQLSTPANRQTVEMTAFPIAHPAVPPNIPLNTITNLSASGIVTTETTSFKVRGTRTSYSFRNPQGSADESAASRAAAGGGAAAAR